MLLIWIGVLIVAAFTLLEWATQPQPDPLTLDFYRTYTQILLKYLPFYTAPLTPDPQTKTFPLPVLDLTGTFQATPADQTAFRNAVQGSLNPLALVAKTTPLLVRILADPSCPIKPLGSVNTRNVIRLLSTEDCLLPTDERLAYTATFGALPGRRRRLGVEFCVRIEVWRERDRERVLEVEAWFLQFLPKKAEPVYDGAGEEGRKGGEVEGGEVVSVLELDVEDPRRWAVVSQDWNLIHVSGLGAKAFGFENVIAHGNHVAALVWGKVIAGKGDDGKAREVEVEFLKPMVLPGKFDVVKAKEGEVWTIKKQGQAKTQMRMSVREINS